MTIAPERPRDPLVPRPIDLPTPVPDGADLAELDRAKIIAAPDDPAGWPAWREALTRWRAEARDRLSYGGEAYDDLAFGWTQSCFAVALAWLWDELLYDHDARRFTPDRFCAEAEQEFGGFDGVVLWHAYPVIGIDQRNQFDFYRAVIGLRELVDAFHARGVRVFVNYNPWDVGTRRQAIGDDEAIARLVVELDVDGVFLDTMKEARPGLRAAVDAVRPAVAFEGESTLPLDRVCDHHLSWAQWFADSAVPGVIRARWFEQRHMLHHTRRWNRDHSDELQSAWLNGVGMLVWENVFGSWVGWSERDKALLRAMLPIQRRHAGLLATGEWTPLAAHGGGDPPTVVASRWHDGQTVLWAAANRADEPYAGELQGAGLHVDLPAKGIAAFVGDECMMVAPSGESAAFPARPAVRIAAPRAVRATPAEGFVEAPAPPPTTTALFRRRETGTYGETPYVEEWKPLPPRLHDFVEVPHSTVSAPRFAIGVREVTNAEARTAGQPDGPATGLDLAAARAYAASVGARLPTEDEWQLAAEAGLLERLEPLVWNWTESEHRDGRTRFAILKGGAAWRAEGSDWYVDGGPREPRYSLKLLLTGEGVSGSTSIGFRLAVDLEQ
jgi:formylglycine-generating enzyme